MAKVLILGSTGMLGHVVTNHLKQKEYEVYATSRNTNDEHYFDALKDVHAIEKILINVKPDFIINCIGILNKDAEEHPSKAIMINSYLPHYLDEISEKYGFKLIHVSTDCVFDGHEGNYTENSIKTAQSIYGKTKGLGEIDNNRSLTLRTSIIGPDPNPNGIGLFQWFMKQEGQVNGFRKVIWTGVTTIELAKQIEIAMKNNLTGLYNVVNGQKISKYDLLETIKKVFNKNIEIIPDDNYISDKSLISIRENYKFIVPDYYQMIVDMKEWINTNSNLYEGVKYESNDNSGH